MRIKYELPTIRYLLHNSQQVEDTRLLNHTRTSYRNEIGTSHDGYSLYSLQQVENVILTLNLHIIPNFTGIAMFEKLWTIRMLAPIFWYLGLFKGGKTFSTLKLQQE